MGHPRGIAYGVIDLTAEAGASALGGCREICKNESFGIVPWLSFFFAHIGSFLTKKCGRGVLSSPEILAGADLLQEPMPGP